MKLRSILLALALALPASASAQDNPSYPVQGVLTLANGDAINGSLSVQFALYEAATGGAALWSETQTVSFDDGLFSIFLGDSSPLDASTFAAHDGLWLGITVDTDPQMDRVFIGSAPYAGYAAIAGNVPTQLSDLGGTLGAGALPAGVPAGPTSCPPGTLARGIQSSGALECVTDQQGAYSGADFALSDQACPSGQLQIGTSATGTPMCDPYLASQACGVGDVVVGFEADGTPQCDSALSLILSGGDLVLGGALLAASGGFTGDVTAGNADLTGDLTAASADLTGSLTAGGGTFNGDVGVTGDVDVQGTLSVSGVNFGYPQNPQLLFGVENSFGANNSTNVGWVDYPARFPQPPILVTGIDESINNNGATWVRTEQNHTNRAALRSDSIMDGLNWMAIEEGVHTVDGKTIMAGSLANASDGAAVFFPALFTQPPVVLLHIDLSGDQAGGARVRIINSVTTGGFEIYLDGAVDFLHWVALDAGEYNYGRYHFQAGVWALNNSCTGGTSACAVQLPPGMFRDSVGLIATVNDTNNSGASYVRARHLGNEDLALYLNANTENVHYIAFEGQ